MFNTLVSHKYKFICFWNAKCACGTLKTWFLNLHGVYEWEYSPHSEVTKYSPQINYDQLDEYPYKDYYKFVVVRNPWKRLVSYYKNKKIIMRHKNLDFPIDKSRPIYSGDMSFAEMVNFLSYSDNNTFVREAHVANQYDGLENIDFDKVVKVENLHKDMLEVKNQLNLPIDFDFNTNYHQPPSPISDSEKYVFDVKPLDFDKEDLPSYEYFYNNELIEKVKNSYLKDVEIFNYNFKD
jgi:hypothetical protein|tara:strand:+ start:109 stop:819 length:711 start_codon:yes stop_codon:yes gene_type:complete